MSFNSILVFAQGKENLMSPSQLTSKKMALKTQKILLSDKLPFSNIKVIDARFDTSKLGFIPIATFFPSDRKQYQQLKLIDGVGLSLEKYYNSQLSNRSTVFEHDLLIVLKKFWVTATKEFSIQKNIPTLYYNESSRIIAKWELYIFKNDTYLPFRRIDTIIESNQYIFSLFSIGNNKYYNKENIYATLNGFIEQFDYSKAIQVFDDRNKKTLSEIIQANNERFNLPILNTTTKKEKAVYMTFDEFKNNSPSITAFKEKKITFSGTRRENYIVNDKDSSINQYYAYATDDYVRVGPYGNETIFRNNNSFEFFLKKRVTRPGAGQGNSLQPHVMLWIPYQIDMETGEFY